MDIVLYTNKTPINRITRSLTAVSTVSGHLREGCDILNPDIRVKYNSALLPANYAYIADFGRWYYMREAPSIEGDIMTLKFHVDVLYTYKDVIQASSCIAERSSSHFSLMLPDSAIAEEAGYYYHSVSLPYEFNQTGGIYILSVSGGF